MQRISTEVKVNHTFLGFGLLKQFFESPLMACVRCCLTLYSNGAYKKLSRSVQTDERKIGTNKTKTAPRQSLLLKISHCIPDWKELLDIRAVHQWM